jgi:ABC-type transport system involved in multi-copper enzyme maturation permease subunit
MSDASLTNDRLAQPMDGESQPLASSQENYTTGILSQIATGWRAFESRLARLGDWVNPILVKETRQALRSWQFTLTFVFLLVACWVVTIGGIAMIGPSVYYAAGGGELLRAYYLILSFPLFIVVPFAAFRSLATEREDNTYELLSITALRPRQIVSGKLASAMVQMAVYYSAIMPCLAFTYLLRGVDAPSIALLLAYTFLVSLALSMLGLLLATLARQRHAHLVLSIALVALLLYVYVDAQTHAAELIRSGYEQYVRREFWVNHFFGGAMYAATVLLAYRAASAMITFATENRSTPLRIAMLLLQAAFIGWMAYRWLTSRFDNEEVLLFATVGACFWLVMGSMLNGEREQLSRRAMRSLPQSGLGRLLFTWFSPGPSSGYAFSVANLTTILLFGVVATEFITPPTRAIAQWPSPDRFLHTLVLGWSYAVAYLGLGALVVALLRKVAVVTMLASVLFHALLLLAGSGIPTCIHWMSIELRGEPYSLLQITNPIWTLRYVLEFSPAPEETVLLVVVPAAAICIWLLNLPALIRELERTPAPLPARIVEDDAELHPPPQALPQSPWDDTEARAGEV